MIRLYVALHGGASYSHPTEADEYPSLAAAAAEYDRRHHDWRYPCWGDPAVGDLTNDGRFYAGFAWYVNDDHPAVSGDRDDNATILDSVGMYPDRELTVGPRGGLKWERC